MSYDSGVGPRLVGYQLASQMYEYMMRSIDLGVFEGKIGHMHVADQIKPILEALHVVLAGGSVKVETTHRGNPDIVHELDRRLTDAIEEANTINGKAGYYVTLTG